MIQALKTAIEALAQKSAASKDALEAMQFAQAALNLGHAAATLDMLKT